VHDVTRCGSASRCSDVLLGGLFTSPSSLLPVLRVVLDGGVALAALGVDARDGPHATLVAEVKRSARHGGLGSEVRIPLLSKENVFVTSKMLAYTIYQ
jgi:hypothetical protein